jgi:hypothetical protein
MCEDLLALWRLGLLVGVVRLVDILLAAFYELLALVLSLLL